MPQVTDKHAIPILISLLLFGGGLASTSANDIPQADSRENHSAEAA